MIQEYYEVKKPKKKNQSEHRSISLPNFLWAKIERAAKAKCITRSMWMRIHIQEAIEKKGK